jgi:hypothetical protein
MKRRFPLIQFFCPFNSVYWIGFQWNNHFIGWQSRYLTIRAEEEIIGG